LVRIGATLTTATSVQFKAARRLLGWSQSKLAGEAAVSATTIGYIESGKRRVPALTASIVRRVLEVAGVEFTEGELTLRKAK
jgi:transcriptional regulator with XRE-family HTH domain